jgi:hypothetical protein
MSTKKVVISWSKGPDGDSVRSQAANYIHPHKTWPGWFVLSDLVPGNGGSETYYHAPEWADHVVIEADK